LPRTISSKNHYFSPTENVFGDCDETPFGGGQQGDLASGIGGLGVTGRPASPPLGFSMHKKAPPEGGAFVAVIDS